MDNAAKFLIYCVEIYKTKNELSGKQVMQLFDQYGINEYILNCYNALHTTGPEYIINDITELIEQKQFHDNIYLK